jgi:hypothetical protein
MSGVFQNIDPPPPHCPASVSPPPPPLVRGEDTLAGRRGDGGSIFWKVPDTDLYSILYICKYFVDFIYFWRSNKNQRSCDGRGGGRAAPRLRWQ